MECAGHIRITGGVVYFRYGGFMYAWHRLLRFVQTVKMIKVGSPFRA